jgi:hypothetical protein
VANCGGSPPLHAAAQKIAERHVSLAQHPERSVAFAVSTEGDPGSMARSVRAAIRATRVDPLDCLRIESWRRPPDAQLVATLTAARLFFRSRHESCSKTSGPAGKSLSR